MSSRGLQPASSGPLEGPSRSLCGFPGRRV